MTEREEIIMRGLDKADKGIEIAPWFWPLAPKSKGYNALGLDIFDTETLRSRAQADPNIEDYRYSEIEPVDLVGNAIDIAEIVERDHVLGTFDYIVSSHNFEHLPDPIKFLIGCGRVLKPGGILSMVIPDHRACFDYFRPHTLLSDWLDAYHGGRRRPTIAQVFAQQAYSSAIRRAGVDIGAFSVSDSPAEIQLTGELKSTYEALVSRINRFDETYVDVHCSVMSPSSFELLLLECRQLNLLQFQKVEISGPVGCEFYARIMFAAGNEIESLPDNVFQAERNRLLHKIYEDNARVYALRTNMHPAVAALVRRIASRAVNDPVGLFRAVLRRAGRRN